MLRNAKRRNPSKYFTNGFSSQFNEIPAIDFQMHTTWTDGEDTVEAMIAAAERLPLKAIAITEHINDTSGYFENFRSEVCKLRQDVDIEIFYGMEISIRDYTGALRTSMMPKEEAEIILGVVHSYPKTSGGYYRFGELTPDTALSCELNGLMGLANNLSIDVIGHPGGTYLNKFGPFPVELLKPIFETARDNGIAIELNTKYSWDMKSFIDLLNDTKPLVSFGSDAHQAADVGSNYLFMRTWSETNNLSKQ